MKKTIEERKEYAKIIARAWADEDFKARLLANPAAVLAESGIEIPAGMTVKVVEQKSDEFHFPLPAKPANLSASVEELGERVQATMCVCFPSAVCSC